MSTKLTEEQRQKAVHLLAEKATLDVTVTELSVHYYQSQVASLDLLTPTALQWVLEEAGFTLEDLK